MHRTGPLLAKTPIFTGESSAREKQSDGNVNSKAMNKVTMPTCLISRFLIMYVAILFPSMISQFPFFPLYPCPFYAFARDILVIFHWLAR
jgi:hypothetical protein